MRRTLIIEDEMEELSKDEHEIFDDYIEMVVTFGYIVIFASVYVLGAALIFIFILIESRSDIFRLESNLKRPIPGKSSQIGPWIYLMEFMSFLGVFSNIIICCFASDQIDYLLPWMKDVKMNSEAAITTVLTLEHLILFIIFIIRVCLDKNPEWVDIFMARRSHKEKTAALKSMPTLTEE